MAVSGSWFTAPHIEWGGGGESVAALISGSKLWIIANSRGASRNLYKLDSCELVTHMLCADPQLVVRNRKAGTILKRAVIFSYWAAG